MSNDYRAYIEENLLYIKERSEVKYPFGRYRGYVEGKYAYCRKDGKPICQEDINNLKELSFGQVSYPVGSVGDEVVFVKFVRDSTG